MKKTILLFSLLLAARSQSQTYSGGLVDDSQIHTPPVYVNWQAPAKGTTYQDAFYGTNITRLSDGISQFNDAVHHEYATMNAFNVNSTYILLQRDMGAFFVVDKSGSIIASNNELNLSNGSEPRWSHYDPNLFYYHDYNSNQLKSFNVSTKQSATVHTFSQFGSITFGGGGDGDLSEDGLHLAICGDGRYVGVFNIGTLTLGPLLDTDNLGTGFAWFAMTPDNNVACRWNTYGAARYNGMEVFDSNMVFLRQLHKYGAHADMGRDVNGDEILVIGAYSDYNPPTGCENNGIEKIKIKDGARSCLIAYNWESELHVSANSHVPWIIVDEIATGCTCSNPDATLPSNWQNGWKHLTNEVVLVKTDGSEVRRLVHHQSRNIGNYWFQPKASISQDGKYVLYDSNMGIQPLSEYTDVFLIDLGMDVPTSTFANENFIANNLCVSPNPATSYINIQNKLGQNTLCRIEVYSIAGQKVIETLLDKVSQVNVSIADLSKGIYVLKVYSTEGVFNQKITVAE